MQTLNIVAHPDDDLLFLNPDILCDIRNGDIPHILYLTAGDDGQDETYVQYRREAIEYAWGPRVSDNLIFGNLKSNCFRIGDKLGDLYRLYRDETYIAASYLGDETYSREAVCSWLRDIAARIRPDIIRIQNPFAEPAVEADGPNLDHIDHIYGAKLAVMSLWSSTAKMYAYEGYPIRHLEANVEFEQAAQKRVYWQRYQSIDTQVDGDIWEVAMTRCYKKSL